MRSLFLDVYVPATARPLSGLPVKVWGYGGGNDGGGLSVPLYDGCNSAYDAIIVTFNYRLSALGFLALQDAGIEGNMALKDYIMALEWVKFNIASFGGDPFKIMLFGQSAGGYDTFAVSTLPQIKELIHSAAVQSGGGQEFASISVASKAGAAYAKTLGCSSSDVSDTIFHSTAGLLGFHMIMVTNHYPASLSPIQVVPGAEECFCQH